MTVLLPTVSNWSGAPASFSWLVEPEAGVGESCLCFISRTRDGIFHCLLCPWGWRHVASSLHFHSAKLPWQNLIHIVNIFFFDTIFLGVCCHNVEHYNPLLFLYQGRRFYTCNPAQTWFGLRLTISDVTHQCLPHDEISFKRQQVHTHTVLFPVF